MKIKLLLFLPVLLICCQDIVPRDPENPLEPAYNKIVEGYNTNKALHIVQVIEAGPDPLGRFGYDPNNIYWKNLGILNNKNHVLRFYDENGGKESTAPLYKGFTTLQYYSDNKYYFITEPPTYKWPILRFRIRYLITDFDIRISIENNYYNEYFQDIRFLEDTLASKYVSVQEYLSRIDNGSYKDSNEIFIRYNSKMPLEEANFMQIIAEDNSEYLTFPIFNYKDILNLSRLNHYNIYSNNYDEIQFVKNNNDHFYYYLNQISHANFFKVFKYAYQDSLLEITIPKVYYHSHLDIQFFDPNLFCYIEPGSKNQFICLNLNELSYSVQTIIIPPHTAGYKFEKLRIISGPFGQEKFYIGLEDMRYDSHIAFFNSNFEMELYTENEQLSSISGYNTKFVIDRDAQLFIISSGVSIFYHFDLSAKNVKFIKSKNFKRLKWIYDFGEYIICYSEDYLVKIRKSDFSIQWEKYYPILKYPWEFAPLVRYISQKRNIMVYLEIDTSDNYFLNIVSLVDGSLLRRFSLYFQTEDFIIGESENSQYLNILMRNGFSGNFRITN